MKLRLLKVIVQPVFALDDGEALDERPGEPVVVSPTDWPTYATGDFATAFEALRQQVEDAPTPDPAKPNRAARRHPPKAT